MKPSDISFRLRNAAARIDRSSNPDRAQVIRNLKNIIAFMKASKFEGSPINLVGPFNKVISAQPDEFKIERENIAILSKELQKLSGETELYDGEPGYHDFLVTPSFHIQEADPSVGYMEDFISVEDFVIVAMDGFYLSDSDADELKKHIQLTPEEINMMSDTEMTNKKESIPNYD